MFISEIHARAFEDELRRTAMKRRWLFAALLALAPRRLAEIVDRAWSWRDAKTAVAATDVMFRMGRLTPGYAVMAAMALLLEGRPARALRLLNSQAQGKPRSGKRVYYLACALAGGGRFESALASAETSLKLDPAQPRTMQLSGQLRRTLELRTACEGSQDWAKRRAHLDSCLALGAQGEAAKLVADALTFPPALEGAACADMFRVLDVGLGLKVDRDAIRRYVASALQRDPGNAFLCALQAEFDVLDGTPGAVRDRPTPTTALDGLGEWRFGSALARAAAGDLDAAVASLGLLTAESLKRQDVRHALARCVGEKVLRASPVRFVRHKPRKIFSPFPFNDELELLKIRLHEMADWVDHFVIVEAAETFAGAPKPLHFVDHAQDFAEFASKIIHVPIEAFPPGVDSPWARDFHQRDVAISAMTGLMSENDLVLIADADEIVDRRAVEGFSGDYACLYMNAHRYFLNYRVAAGRWGQTGPTGAIWRAKHLSRFGMSYARFALSRRGKQETRIMDAGWHFSSLGAAERITRKLANYAHQEHAPGAGADGSWVEPLLRQIKAGDLPKGWERCDIDDSFPRYVREHRDELADLIL